MFDSFLGNVKGYLGKAFVLTAWLPVFVFACLGLVVYLAGNRSFEAVWHAWLSLPLGDQVAVTIAFLAPVTLLAFVIHHLEGPIVRFFEGYWENWFLLRNIG